MRGGLGVPEPLVDEIMQRRFSTDSEKSHAISSAYVNIRPNPSWEDLCWKLYAEKEFAAARKSKTFMFTGKYSHYVHTVYIAELL